MSEIHAGTISVFLRAAFLPVMALCFIFNGCSGKSESERLSLIAAIQQDIADTDRSPAAYYRKSYAPIEPRYWTKIAAWMVEDSINRSNIQSRPVSSILDLGCGYGTLLAFSSDVYGAAGTCLDVVPYLQPEIMNKYNLSFIECNIEKDPFPDDKQYDVIIMTEVLEHLNFQPVPTLRKACDSLSDGGAFFLSTPDADSGWGRTMEHYASLDDIPAVDPDAEWVDGHIWQYNQRELEGILHEAGFEILRLEHSEGIQGKHFNVWATKRMEPKDLRK